MLLLSREISQFDEVPRVLLGVDPAKYYRPAVTSVLGSESNAEHSRVRYSLVIKFIDQVVVIYIEPLAVAHPSYAVWKMLAFDANAKYDILKALGRCGRLSRRTSDGEKTEPGYSRPLPSSSMLSDT